MTNSHKIELTALYEAASVALAFVDADGRFVHVNDRMGAVTGVPAADHLGRSVREILPEFADQVEKDIAKVLENGRSATKISYHARPVGAPDTIRHFKLDFHPVKGDAGGYLGVLIQARDITKREAAEGQRTEQARLLELLFRHTLSPLVLLDRNFNFLRVNEAYAEADGKRVDDFIGRNHFEMYPSDAIGIFREVVKTKEAVQINANPFEYAEHPERGITYWDWQLVPILDSKGEVEILLFSLNDVTDRIRAQEERSKVTERLLATQKFESLAVMAGGIARDLNNMMQVVVGYSDLVLHTGSLDSTTRPMIERISNAAVRAAELGNQMLSYAGRSAPTMHEVDLNGIVKSENAALRKVAGNCKFEIKVAGGRVAAFGDDVSLQSIIIHLVQNAAQAIVNAPGTIEIVTGFQRVTPQMLADAAVEAGVGTGDRPFVEVNDTGSGISPEIVGRIFDPFFTTKTTGRGFGLAAVASMVQAHNGAIMVKTSPGMGTTVRVLLRPAESSESEALLEAEDEAPDWFGGGTVLVVDDEADVTSFEATFLEQCGFQVVTARDVDSTEELFRRNKKTLVAVLLDFSLGTANGAEVARALKNIDPSVPILMCSGYSEDEIIGRVGSLEVEAFIPKPFSGKQLRQAMRKLLDK